MLSPTNENMIDFRISLDESNDEDYNVIFNENSFSHKIISVSDLKYDSKYDNGKNNVPSSPKPTIDYLDDLDCFNDFKNKFPVIVYNDGLTSKSNLEIEPPVRDGAHTNIAEAKVGGARRRMTWRQFVLALGLNTKLKMADARGEAPEKMTDADLFYLRSMDRRTANVSHLLAYDEGLRGFKVVTHELPLIDLHKLGRLNICLSTLIGSSRLPYQSHASPRTGDASTFAAPWTNDQPDP
uniref:Uncharacterized protein n=1 Tax=Tanacetum cinerariifolium TaxID=118510 RepID=A0A6L2LFU0_TANCI|nr:hypothetical protein [Tanacetum cinerariifolium]